MTTWRIDFGYDGGAFFGYAAQPGKRTVQETLETALFRHTGPVKTEVAGRTDSGVHASGQVVSFTTSRAIDPVRLTRSFNSQLGPEIAVASVTAVPDDFNARFSATGRTYHYLVLNRDVPDPFLCHTSWRVGVPIDLAVMAEESRAFVGLKDYAALCRRSAGRTTERHVRSAVWSDLGNDMLRFEVRASSFCHQMVRSMVAIAVDAGRGKIAPGYAAAAVAAMERSRGRGVAPPHGLMLVSVDYD